MPLFSLLVCFPLPVGNCTLSLLPSRRFPPVRICHCSSIRFRVFCLPPFLLLLVLRPLPRPVSLCLLSTLVVPSILPMQLDFSPPTLSRVPARARQKEGDPGRPGIGVRPRPGFEFNYSSPHYTRERDENYASTIIFSRELSLPLYRRLNAPLDCVPRAHLCGPYARTGITSRFLCLSLSLRFIPSHFTMYIYLDIAGEEEVIRLNSGLN